MEAGDTQEAQILGLGVLSRFRDPYESAHKKYAPVNAFEKINEAGGSD